MIDEPVQIVDRTGNVIGTADMLDAFERGLVRNTAYVILTDSTGRCLLQKRSEGAPNYPGYWDASAGGHIDAGELPETAAYRELAEELSVKDIELKHVTSFYFESEGDGRVYKYYAHVYKGELTNEGQISAVSEEVSSTELFTKEDALKLEKITPIAQHIVDLL